MSWISRVFHTMSTVKNVPNYPEIIKTLIIDEQRTLELKVLKSWFATTKSRYDIVSKQTMDFPSDLMFALHYREDACDFKGVLHNGEHIIGTSRKTRLVPAGRGPFNTWEEAAVDALMMKKAIFPKEWNLATKLEFAEKYNGLGYRKTGELSPYVFAGTNFSDETGKYVADGKFDPNAKERQLGVAAILLTC